MHAAAAAPEVPPDAVGVVEDQLVPAADPLLGQRLQLLADAELQLTGNLVVVEGEGGFNFPTNIASMNLVMGCSRVFFPRYFNTCPGVPNAMLVI